MTTNFKIKKRNFDLNRFKEFDNHEMLMTISDAQSGLNGYIGIHNTNLGPALGGTRLRQYRSQTLAIRDALNLSKAMSYKCALAGLPFGGGKAVIVDTKGLDKKALLTAYSRMIENLGGLFKTGTDVGINDEDVSHMSTITKHVLGVTKADRGDMSTSKIAALGVFYSITASLNEVYGTSELKGRKINIKGVGKLGSELVKLLHAEGARIFISDIDLNKCQNLKEQYPNINIVNNNMIFTIDSDVYAPCALGGEFTASNVKKIKTKIIAGGANNQLLNERVGDLIFSRNILYAPDYVANSGGLIYVADELEEDGFQLDRVLKRTLKIKDTLNEVFKMSKELQMSTNRIANDIAIKKLNYQGGSDGH